MERPSGRFVVPEFVVPAWSWYFGRFKLNITHRSNFLDEEDGTYLEKRGVNPFLCNWLVSVKAEML